MSAAQQAAPASRCDRPLARRRSIPAWALVDTGVSECSLRLDLALRIGRAIHDGRPASKLFVSVTASLCTTQQNLVGQVAARKTIRLMGGARVSLANDCAAWMQNHITYEAKISFDCDVGEPVDAGPVITADDDPSTARRPPAKLVPR